MAVRYGKKIRTIMKGKYSDLKRDLPLLCEAVKYRNHGGVDAHTDRSHVEWCNPEYSIELVQEDDKYIIVFVASIDTREEVGSGDSGSVYWFTSYTSCHHMIDVSFIEDDKKILENIIDDKWTDFVNGDIYFKN